MGIAQSFSHDVGYIMPFQPFIVPALPQSVGAPNGTCLRTQRRIPIDIYAGQRDGLWASGEQVFAGLKMSGKTTGMKYVSMLTMAQQAINRMGEVEDMRLMIDNRKPEEGEIGEDTAAEWAPIVDVMGCESFKAHNMRLETFHPDTLKTEADRLISGRNQAEALKGLPLDVDERIGLRVAIHALNSVAHDLIGLQSLALKCRQITSADVKDFLRCVNNDVAARFATEAKSSAVIGKQLQQLVADPGHNININAVVAGAARVAKYLLLIVNGEFGKMFAGSQSLADYLRRAASMIDLSNMSVQETAFFEALRFDTMRAHLDNGDISCIPHVHIREEIQEEGEGGDHTGIGAVKLRAEAFWNAKARAFHRTSFSSSQYLGNMFHGPPDSDERRYSEQIFNGTDIFWLFRQSDDPRTREILHSLDLTPSEIEMSMGLDQGCCIVKARGRDPMYLQIHLPNVMKKLVKSQSSTKRMTSRIPVAQHPYVIAQIQQREANA